MRLYWLLILVALMSLAGCGGDGSDYQPRRCVDSHTEVEEVWVPMSPGGFHEEREYKVCDKWEVVR